MRFLEVLRLLGCCAEKTYLFCAVQDNFKLTLGNVQVKVPTGIKFIGLALALKVEAQATRNAFAKHLVPQVCDSTTSLTTSALQLLRDSFLCSYDPDYGTEPAADVILA
jgi:hypothetical protein